MSSLIVALHEHASQVSHHPSHVLDFLGIVHVSICRFCPVFECPLPALPITTSPKVIGFVASVGSRADQRPADM